MDEGVDQDCQLSSTLVALVLHEMLTPLNGKLKARAKCRLHIDHWPGDDKGGGKTHPMACVDDNGDAGDENENDDGDCGVEPQEV